jgi:hypothetical protein
LVEVLEHGQRWLSRWESLTTPTWNDGIGISYRTCALSTRRSTVVTLAELMWAYRWFARSRRCAVGHALASPWSILLDPGSAPGLPSTGSM